MKKITNIIFTLNIPFLIGCVVYAYKNDFPSNVSLFILGITITYIVVIFGTAYSRLFYHYKGLNFKEN